MSVEQLKQAMTKTADKAENNEDSRAIKGVNNVYETPKGRAPGTLDAKWGDEPPLDSDNYPVNYSEAVKREAHDGRAGMIERLFDSPKTTAPVEQAMLRQLFNPETVSEGHPPHSPMLQRGRVKEASVAGEESLTDQVMRVVGHR